MLNNYEHNHNILLADDMGLGKTITTLTFMLGLINSGAINRAIIIVPVSLIDNWIREIYNWYPKAINLVYLHAGSCSSKGNLRKNHFENVINQWDKFIMITTLNYLQRDDYLSHCEYQFILIDEAHFVRNIRTKSYDKISNLIGSKVKVCMTGTPIQNSYRDLFALMQFLEIHEFGSATIFKNNFIKPIERGLLSDASEFFKNIATMKIIQLREMVKIYMIRREKCEIMKLNKSPLPPKVDIIIWVMITHLQKGI